MKLTIGVMCIVMAFVLPNKYSILTLLFLISGIVLVMSVGDRLSKLEKNVGIK